MGDRRDAPNDPARPDRILRAALDVISEHGIRKASHGRIAQAARVSPGSLTYYFSGIDDIYARAFRKLAAEMSVVYEAKMASVSSVDDAVVAVTDLICGDYAAPYSMRLIFEMYAYAKHNDDVAALTAEWTVRSRESLARHFSEPASRAIDALVEGWPMHREFEHRPIDRDDVTATIRAIANTFPRTN